MRFVVYSVVLYVHGALLHRYSKQACVGKFAYVICENRIITFQHITYPVRQEFNYN
jgi:hypothetical protein